MTIKIVIAFISIFHPFVNLLDYITRNIMYNYTMKKEIKHIAIVRLSALGDIVNSAVVLQFIHQFYPNVKIDWITEEVFAPLLEEHPLLNKVIRVNLKKIKKEKKISLLQETIKKLSNTPEYDLVIDMQGLIKSALVSKFLARNRHGFDKNSTRESFASLFYTTKSNISYEENVVKRNIFVVADALDLEITPQMILDKKRIFPITEVFSLDQKTKHIAFVIGASWASKIYPKEKVVEVCNKLQETCHIIWGNEEEKSVALWICEHSPYATLAPKLSLSSLVSFISAMDLLIGNDTGPTHMAWAQNIPSLTLLGPTTTRMIYETPHNIGIKSASEVNILKINKQDFSIQEIPAKEIIQKAKGFLS
jgi:heptosyltransferase-1